MSNSVKRGTTTLNARKIYLDLLTCLVSLQELLSAFRPLARGTWPQESGKYVTVKSTSGRKKQAGKSKRKAGG
jgi:hypothetical protein